MAFIGNQPTAVPLTSSQLADGLITTAKLAADAVTSAKILDSTIVNADIASTTINLTQKVTGTLPFANGGTSLSTLGTAGQALVVNSSATALEYATVGAQAGQVIQVVSTNKTDTFSMSSGTFADITGLSVSITPASASNKILVIATLGVISGTSLNQMFFKMVRDSTNLLLPSSAGSRTLCNFGIQVNGADKANMAGYQLLDSPNTTSSVSYKVQAASQATVNINVTNANDDASYTARGTATITVMEIKG